MVEITFGEMRSNAEKIADEVIKERVVRGIELLNERFGPDWVERIDPTYLCLGSSNRCILGQVYRDADEAGVVNADPDFGPWEEQSGFLRALQILNGDFALHPQDWGFEFDGFASYVELNDAWRLALGLETV